MAEADLSKVISLIMENPTLVEQIRNMVNSSEKAEESSAEKATEPESSVLPDIERTTYSDVGAARRNELLRAIRPYLSEQRGRVIESMITISDILSISKKEK